MDTWPFLTFFPSHKSWNTVENKTLKIQECMGITLAAIGGKTIISGSGAKLAKLEGGFVVALLPVAAAGLVVPQ